MARKRNKSVLTKEVLEYFQQQGQKGGKTGGKLRWQGVSAADRSALARKAVAAREAKKRAKVGK